MADAVPELILQHLEMIVSAAVAIPVYRSRDAALAERQLPAIVMLPLDDVPSEDSGSVCWLNWEFSVAFDVVVGDGKDSAAHPYRAAIHNAVMSDRELTGAPGVTDVALRPVTYQMDSRVTELAFVRVAFVIRYRTRHDDLTVAPV